MKPMNWALPECGTVLPRSNFSRFRSLVFRASAINFGVAGLMI